MGCALAHRGHGHAQRLALHPAHHRYQVVHFFHHPQQLVQQFQVCAKPYHQAVRLQQVRLQFFECVDRANGEAGNAKLCLFRDAERSEWVKPEGLLRVGRRAHGLSHFCQ